MFLPMGIMIIYFSILVGKSESQKNRLFGSMLVLPKEDTLARSSWRLGCAGGVISVRLASKVNSHNLSGHRVEIAQGTCY